MNLNLEANLQDIRSEFLKIRQSKSHTAFPEQLKSQVIELWEKGVSHDILCQELQLHSSLLYKWRKNGKEKAFSKQNMDLKIRKIPIVHSHYEDSFLEPKNKKSPKFLFQFYSLKISWS